MKLRLNNKLRYSLYAVLACVFLSSCSFDNNGFGDFGNVKDEAKHINDGDVKFETVVIDSCEYIYSSRTPLEGSMMIAHKGNCKYCEKRNAR